MTGLTHLSLFTGIGGIDLAAEAAGFETIAQVERDNYCRRVLAKHWPGVPRFDDVRDVTADALRDAGIGRPTLVSGGFPCQPFSCAGKRRGAADDRFLWLEMCRIVSECRPAWVLGENVAGFVGMALDDCAADLERLGYAVRAFVVPAAGVGAPHQRARCFIVVNTAGRDAGPLGDEAPGRDGANGQREGRRLRDEPRGSRTDVADADRDREQQPQGPLGAIGRRPRDGGASLADADEPRPQGHGRLCERPGKLPSWAGSRADEDEWLARAGVCRVSHGVPNRVHRLRALGNAVVPAQVYPFVQAIADIERGVIA